MLFSGSGFKETAQIDISGTAGPLELAAIASSGLTEGDIDLTLANLRYSQSWFDIDVGRVGVPYGLTPPIYSVATPQASQPDTYSALGRLLVGVIGFPDLGAGLTLHVGDVDIALHAYRPTEISVARVVALAQTVAPGQALVDAGPLTPGECSLCNVVNGAIGTDIGPDTLDAVPIWPEDVPGGSESLPPRLGRQLYHAGVYRAGRRYQIAIDAGHLRLGRETVTAIVAGYAFDASWANFVIQPMYLWSEVDAVGGHLSMVLTAWSSLPFARAGWLNGAIDGQEYAAGVVIPWGWVAVRLGYEVLVIGETTQSGFAGGVSVRF